MNTPATTIEGSPTIVSLTYGRYDTCVVDQEFGIVIWPQVGARPHVAHTEYGVTIERDGITLAVNSAERSSELSGGNVQERTLANGSLRIVLASARSGEPAGFLQGRPLYLN